MQKYNLAFSLIKQERIQSFNFNAQAAANANVFVISNIHAIIWHNYDVFCLHYFSGEFLMHGAGKWCVKTELIHFLILTTKLVLLLFPIRHPLNSNVPL